TVLLNRLGISSPPDISRRNHIDFQKEEGMQFMIGKKIIPALRVLIAITCIAVAPPAADVMIRGAVTDNAGKPIRGAIVKATFADKTVARFTSADGRYEITLPPGKYSISAEAYGFALKTQSKDVAQADALDFSLTPRFSVYNL